MSRCKHYEVCGLEASPALPPGDSCILHSAYTGKPQEDFARALAAHRQNGSENFSYIIFPEDYAFDGLTFRTGAIFFGTVFRQGASFRGTTFERAANFSEALFAGPTSFHEAVFHTDANFSRTAFLKTVSLFGVTCRGDATFIEASFEEESVFGKASFIQGANFVRATFGKGAYFFGVVFGKEADFFSATFRDRAGFREAVFSDRVDFDTVTFGRGANFSEATFGVRANFRQTEFLGGTLFAAKHQDSGPPIPIFAGTEVDFRQVSCDPPDAVTFREADFRKCRFLDTDLRKVQLIGVEWPLVPSRLSWSGTDATSESASSRSRIGVYDELAPAEDEGLWSWPRVERLYRELKQNYEERRDYHRAGYFHYGEKDARRRDPANSFGLRFLLTLYWWISGYGDRIFRPLLWAFGLFAACTLGYLLCGLSPAPHIAGTEVLSLANPLSWVDAGLFSFQAMAFFQPEEFMLSRFARLIYIVQSLLGPLFLTLFGVAVWQRLRR